MRLRPPWPAGRSRPLVPGPRLVDGPDWPALIDGVLTDPSRLGLVFQPIVSVADGTVAGYEALSRFAVPDGLPPPTPDRWFTAADALGRGAELEAIVVRRCLGLRAELPPNTFLTVNVSPHLVTAPAIAGPLLAAGDLAPLVLELTEHQEFGDPGPLIALRDELADRGCLLALDDAGSGYSGLQQLTRFRPDLIKLDRALVAGADSDEVKLALAELLGEFAGRIDAWLLAEGVETWGELEAFARLGVPLAQGFLLGRPAPAWAALDPAHGARLRALRSQLDLTENVASLVERVPLSDGRPAVPGRFGIRTDAWGRPEGLLLPGPNGHRSVPVSLRVLASEQVTAVARRLVARPEDVRFDPVACVDERGQAVGLIRVERVIARLAELRSED